MTLKEELYNHCVEQVNARMKVCETRINSIENDLANESKSSAGDKHETGRAMLHLEREKLGNQLAIIQNEKNILDKVVLNENSEMVNVGSIVKTSNFNYFVLISAGIAKIQEEYICISAQSPIGKLLKGKAVGDKVSFNGKSFTITRIE